MPLIYSSHEKMFNENDHELMNILCLNTNINRNDLGNCIDRIDLKEGTTQTDAVNVIDAATCTNRIDLVVGTTQTDPIDVIIHPETRNASTQTVTIEANVRDAGFLDRIKSTRQLSSCTGLNSFSCFEKICCAVSYYIQNRLEKDDVCSLDVHNRVLLTLMKIKISCSFLCLSVLFNVSNVTCQRYFSQTIRILSAILKPFIQWPSKESVQNNFPEHFSAFPNTRVVLDCTEMAVYSAPCVTCRLQTYSHYKKRHTLKIMIGIAPSGMVSVISKIFGGKASDKFIMEYTKIVDLCDKNDMVMVDKGYVGEEILCREKNIKLIRPPFRRGNCQLSYEKCEENRGIARARVHVERCIQRLKNFKILSSEIEWNMVTYMEDIITVICGLVNLPPPILADDSFIGFDP